MTLPFLTKKRKSAIAITLITKKSKNKIFKSMSAEDRKTLEKTGFGQKTGATAFLPGDDEVAERVYFTIDDPIKLYDMARCYDAIKKHFDESYLGKACCILINDNISSEDLDKVTLGWAFGAYRFTAYKSNSEKHNGPKLFWPKGANRKNIEARANALYRLRDLINTPTNDMGPDKLEKAIRSVARAHEAKIKVIKGKALLDEQFPLIHTVGRASAEEPRLVELTWGDAKHPRVTLVGKGVCFDTGGLNIKPNPYMAHMKKDMGGAAHALALAEMIMGEGLPVHLRLLIPAVENSISSNAFRPGDVIKSRKGLHVENTNTDAEGRLILADALTLASEGKEAPEIIIDFATLTGSARAALGPDIPAFFSLKETSAKKLQKLSFEMEDPLWAMPLWEPYYQHIEKGTGDLVNSAGLPGDLIYSALFLQKFLHDDYKGEWLHIDCYAWEHTGRPGRPRGGADTGAMAVFHFLKDRYA